MAATARLTALCASSTQYRSSLECRCVSGSSRQSADSVSASVPSALPSSSRFCTSSISSVSSNFNGTRVVTLVSKSHRSGRRGFSVQASQENGGVDKEYDYDLFTIGAGSGGVRASRFASQYGARVAVCELPFSTISSDSTGGVGGTCVIRGCVPKKLLVYGSEFPHEFKGSAGFGWTIPEPPVHSWQTLIGNKNKELDRLTNAYRTTLKNANVTLLEGRGKVVDPHTVDVDGQKYTAKHILIAVGGRAFVPAMPGSEHVITSDEALDLPSRPNKIVIVGGGYIALEFACIFRGLGSEVHVVMRQNAPLRGFDEEVRSFLAERLTSIGIQFHPEATPTSVEKLSDGNLVLVTDKGERIEADTIMFGTGRNPNTKNLGLEEVGVKLDKRGGIVVDDYLRTAVPSISALGDVINRIALTPVALMEGTAFAKTNFNDQPTIADYENVASAVFTQPQIGTVGFTEEKAIEEFGDIDVFSSNFRPMKATISGSSDRTMLKVIVDVASDRVVGVHYCGESAGEIMQGIAIAVKAGCTKADFDGTVGIHPTAAEEFVSLRTPTRQIRKKKEEKKSEGKTVANA